MVSTSPMTRMQSEFEATDKRITRWLARYGITLLRIGLGIVFFWFGIIKFVPGLSPAEDLAARTITMLSFGIVPPQVSIPLLAAWETLIGIGLIGGKFMRVTIFLLLVQMLGTITPLFLLPHETWRLFPISPTLEGQYIIKNIVLVTAALVIGATVRGGYVLAEPNDCK